MAVPLPVRPGILTSIKFIHHHPNYEVTVKTIVTTVLAVLLLSPLAVAQQAPLKIGYVNSEKIIAELPEAKESQQKLETMVKGWQDEIEKRSQALQGKFEEYQKQANMLNESAKQARQKELVEEEQKLNVYRQEKQQELAVQREKVMKPIQEKVFKAIERVAKDKKLSFVFDRANEVPVLYADPTFDYTPDVIIYLKRGGK
ncbi:MAG: OmpH family outer membrane protein [Bacteroidetes bacterium]|nr:MAG: OmpH family outer membrane protein [Bacteroidota bacterium]